MVEESSGPAKSVPLSELSHLVRVPLSEVLLYIFVVQVRLGQMYNAPQVRPNWGSNSIMTSRSWLYISCHWDTCSNQSAISDLYTYAFIFIMLDPVKRMTYLRDITEELSRTQLFFYWKKTYPMFDISSDKSVQNAADLGHFFGTKVYMYYLCSRQAPVFL